MGKQLLIFKVWRHKAPALWGMAVILAVLLWPSIPLQGFLNWMDFLYNWYPQNILYVIMAIFSGFYTALYAYNKTVAPTCPAKGSKGGIFGSLGGILLGACPACIPVLGFILPLSVILTLGFFSWIFIVIAIGAILFSIYKMNGFKKI